MAEELRKGENDTLNRASSDPASQECREKVGAGDEDGADNVLDDVMEDRATETAR